MKYSFKIFKISQIPVELHISFLTLILLIYIIALFKQIPSVTLLTTLLITIIFISIIIHEISHYYIAKHYNIKIQRIILLPIGAITETEETSNKPVEELKIALAGPVANLITAIITFINIQIFGDHLPTLISTILYNFTIINLLLGLFNLIPASPMDGGNILRAFLAKKMDYIKAAKITVIIGKQLAIIIVIIGILYNFLLILVAIFIYLGAEGEYQSVLISTLLKDEKVENIMTSPIHTLNPNTTLQETLNTMFHEKHTEYPITDNGKLIGIITFQTITQIPENNRNIAIKEIMNTKPITSHPNENLIKTIEKLNQNNIEHLPVIENNKLIGIISKTDITKTIKKKEKNKKLNI